MNGSHRGASGRPVLQSRGRTRLGDPGIAAAAALLYAILGATVNDADSYATVPIPSDALVELPGGETEISLATPVAATGGLPADLRIAVVGQDGVALDVDARGGEDESRTIRGPSSCAAVRRPSGAGTYEVTVTSDAAAARGSQLMFGEGPVGTIGARFERLGELVAGPFGILAGVLLAVAILLPPFRRALARQR